MWYRRDGSTGRCSLLPCSMVAQVCRLFNLINWEIYFIFDLSTGNWVWHQVKVERNGFYQVQIPSGSFHARLVGIRPQMVQILGNR